MLLIGTKLASFLIVLNPATFNSVDLRFLSLFNSVVQALRVNVICRLCESFTDPIAFQDVKEFYFSLYSLLNYLLFSFGTRPMNYCDLVTILFNECADQKSGLVPWFSSALRMLTNFFVVLPFIR